MPETHAIWDRIRSDETAALEELYRKYFKDLYNYGMRMSKDVDLVEDAIQETYLNIWKYRNKMSTPQSEKAYLLRAYRNQLIQLFRTRSRTIYKEEIIRFDFDVSMEQKVIEGENTSAISAKINKALEQLTTRQREIIYYRFFEGLSYDDIAEIMNMQTRATYKLAARAIIAMRQILGSKLFSLLLI